MAELQQTMLTNAAGLVAPGGLLVYATCSLEPEEGERQVAAFLAAQSQFRARSAIDPVSHRCGPPPGSLAAGELRTLPFHLSGMDGFYAACLRRPRPKQLPVFPQRLSRAALYRLLAPS